ncbi:DUF4880 domain-containing protein [Lampropedia puyangensis]|uniref:DUF4880 domain-containing protein n=1 Tax=Lampropedia puyangensis TaxID=1330072 RepID=A0A4S8EVA1_9BURK|nr:FecR domain-containing protein [Lampropedia puyangensis]THT97453.1 DUF4880 domain-containing protein [Lampropedia puyangensis]
MSLNLSHNTPPPLPQCQPDAAMLQQAAHWFAVLQDERRSEDEYAQWQHWLQADPAHRMAWQRVEQIGGHVATLDLASQGRTRHLLDAVHRQGVQRQRRTTLKAALLLVGIGGAGWGLGQSPWWRTRQATHVTAVGQRGAFTLADGSTLWLNADSRVRVDYQQSLRLIHLLAGEMLLETAADTHHQARPLVVHTAHGRVRPLGTVFSVRQWDQETQVTVFEGAVRIRLEQAQEEKTIVYSGQQTCFSQHAVQPVSPAQHARQAWRDGLLVADGMRLDHLLVQLASYRSGWLTCDSAVGALKVVGVFRLDDTESALQLLQNSLPIRVRKMPLGWTRITAL